MTRPSRLVRTLTLGLTLSLSLLSASSHATKPLPPPPESISQNPEVRVYSNIPSGEPVPKEVRLNVTVERAGFAEAWRQHAFKITLPSTPNPALSVPTTGTAPAAGGKREQKRNVRQ